MTSAPQPYEYLRASAERSPDAIAIATTERTMSYSFLADASARIGTVLRERGIQPGDVVALNLPFDINALFTWATIHEAATTCMFHPFMIDNDFLDVRLVITTVPIEGLEPARTFFVNENFLQSLEEVPATPNIPYPNDDAIVRMAFTSGTTGRPKAIAVDLVKMEAMRLYYGHFNPSDGGFFSTMPPLDGPGWVYQFFDISEGRTYLVPGSAAENITLLNRWKYRNMLGSAGQLSSIVELLLQRGGTLEHLDYVASVGSQLPTSIAQALQQLTGGTTVTNAYGSTEGAGIARRDDADPTANYMGELLEEAEVQIVDPETLQPVAHGEVGLIAVRGEHVASGYYRDPEATAKHFIDGWFYSGDLGRLDGTKLFLEGRESERINSGGVKVDPAAIDDVLHSLDVVSDCAAFALRTPNGLDLIAAAVVLRDDRTDAELTEAVSARLRSETPRVWVRVESIPRNPNGKPLRRDLTERYSQPSGS